MIASLGRQLEKTLALCVEFTMAGCVFSNWRKALHLGVLALALSSLSVRTAGAEELRPGAAGLLADVALIVDAIEGEGWFHDAAASDEAHTVVLESVCRTTDAARASALAQLHARQIGEPKQLFESAGRTLTDEVELALSLERQLRILRRAVVAAPQDCPFWVSQHPGFTGRQTTRDSYALHFEGGGIVQLRSESGDFAVGGGGGGRVLLGRGFGNHWSLLAGLEMGGGALLKRSGGGQFTINYFPAVPFVLRLRAVGWLYDLELSPVALFQSDDTRVSFGVRAGGLVGVTTLRTRGFLPWAGIGIAVEHYFPGAGRDSLKLVRGGLRVGFRWLL